MYFGVVLALFPCPRSIVQAMISDALYCHVCNLKYVAAKENIERQTDTDTEGGLPKEIECVVVLLLTAFDPDLIHPQYYCNKPKFFQCKFMSGF